jgi:hypothetical protein
MKLIYTTVVFDKEGYVTDVAVCRTYDLALDLALQKARSGVRVKIVKTPLSGGFVEITKNDT